jgi:hypothetical protein
MVKERIYYYVYTQKLIVKQNNLDRPTGVTKEIRTQKRVFVFVSSCFIFSYSIMSRLLFSCSYQKSSFLAGSDEESQRRWVVVLEEVQAQATLG